MKEWLTSDTHFDHRNIIEYIGRQFRKERSGKTTQRDGLCFSLQNIS